ncbi:hypothetical protein PRZ48_012651 [Zasmidium cellare]|uniref:O-methyltransferase domain-containing protein n=1 Tax=Zasmidium cellare TaxID=395010 RepID=A0ABR0E5G1_ZASCE|nr:hypothetical protein PRZ48_012651 [Zasmidium cellare]
MSSKEIQSLIGRINSIHASAKGDIASDKTATYQLLLASRQLNAALEDPSEIATFNAFSGIQLMCVRLAIELRIFEKLASAEKPLTAADLAADGCAEEGLIVSVARVLGSKGFLAETKTSDGNNALVANPMTRHMTVPSVRARSIFHYDSGLPILTQGLSYFRSTNFRLQKGHDPCLFQFAHDTTDDSYVFFSKQPGVMENFSTYMQGYLGSEGYYAPAEWFPFDEVCLRDFDPGRGEYVYVDVGGGKGQHVQRIVERFGDGVQGGKFLVQDLGPVIEDIDKSGMALDARIEKQAYDYMTPQPIRGARAYMFENIFHYHNDFVSKDILEIVKEAMVPGYSKLLISTLILPEQGVPFALAVMDVMTNCVNGGRERTEAELRALLESCGFRIVKFWYPPAAGNGVIEAELA